MRWRLRMVSLSVPTFVICLSCWLELLERVIMGTTPRCLTWMGRLPWNPKLREVALQLGGD